MKHQTQLDYLNAKRKYEETQKAIELEMVKFDHLLDSEAGIDEYCEIEEKTENRIGLDAIIEKMNLSEQKMVDFAFGEIMVTGLIGITDSARKSLKSLYEKSKHDYKVMVKVVDLVLKLDWA